MGDGVSLAVANDDIGLTPQNRFNQLGDFGAGILVVAVGVEVLQPLMTIEAITSSITNGTA